MPGLQQLWYCGIVPDGGVGINIQYMGHGYETYIIPEIIFSYSSHQGIPVSPRASSIISGRFSVVAILFLGVERIVSIARGRKGYSRVYIFSDEDSCHSPNYSL